MQTGVIQFYLKDKGYGYIRIPETREEIFVQAKHLLNPVEKGDKVIFRIRENKGGLFAVEVRKVTG